MFSIWKFHVVYIFQKEITLPATIFLDKVKSENGQHVLKSGVVRKVFKDSAGVEFERYGCLPGR